MKYKQQVPFVDGDWDQHRKASKANFEYLEKIDNEAKKRSELLWRYFTSSQGDGRCYYQIIKVGPVLTKIRLCTGIDLDNWTNSHYWYRRQHINR